MISLRILRITGLLLPLLPATPAPVQQAANSPLPPIPQLVSEVREHQWQFDKVRENYTYTSLQTTEDIDANGQVQKTETVEDQEFFVNGHVIERTVKKNGSPLNDHDQQREAERVSALGEKAKRTPPDQQLVIHATNISRLPEIITRVLGIMDVRNPRREIWHHRPTIVFDFIGRKDAKTRGLAEDTSKNIQGTIWIDEADRQVARLEVIFNDDFRLVGGLVASVEKGSRFIFDQTLVNGELWLPTGGEGTLQARVLLLMSYRQHFFEHDYDYKCLRVEPKQVKGARVVPGNEP